MYKKKQDIFSERYFLILFPFSRETIRGKMVPGGQQSGLILINSIIPYEKNDSFNHII
jgi:hypothetical protein